MKEALVDSGKSPKSEQRNDEVQIVVNKTKGAASKVYVVFGIFTMCKQSRLQLIPVALK